MSEFQMCPACETTDHDPRDRCFHTQPLAQAAVEEALQIRAVEKLNRVCLSAGSFQIFTLPGASVELLESAGFEVFLYALAPSNDGGSSLGQAACANRRLGPI